jgi:hypothetical protein
LHPKPFELWYYGQQPNPHLLRSRPTRFGRRAMILYEECGGLTWPRRRSAESLGCHTHAMLGDPPSRMPRDLIDYFVLDTCADDIEALEQIVSRLNHPTYGWREYHAEPFVRSEVLLAILRCVRDDLLRAAVPDHEGTALRSLAAEELPMGAMDDAWFELTSRGRMILSAWEPPGAQPSA